MPKTLNVLCIVVVSAACALAAVSANVREYRHKAVGKPAIAGAVAKGGFNTLRNSPHEWGRSPAGFAKRVGSSFGQHVAKESIQFGVAAAHHENLHYQRSNLQGKWPRVKYAVKSTFIVPRTNKPG